VTIPAASSLYTPGLPSGDITLQWATFSGAAAEAGLSRIYGGIHFVNADTAGRTLGQRVGAEVFERARRHWSGVA
jgi:alpha-glucosidase (family GH31 glycosyl hydrolase)